MPDWKQKMFKVDRFDAVVKIGGSVVWNKRNPVLSELFNNISESRRILIVTGGGDIDNYIEEFHARHELPYEILHQSTTLSQDITGLILCGYSNILLPVRSILDASKVADAGGIPVLLPSNLMFLMDTLRYTNRFSSDSMSAYIASVIGVNKVILLKSRTPLVTNTPSGGNQGDRDLVDEVFYDLVDDLDIGYCIVSPDKLDDFKDWLTGKDVRLFES